MHLHPGDSSVMDITAPTRLPAYYTGLWTTLMSFAIAYMGLLAIKPELTSAVLPTVKLAAVLMDEDDQELRRAAAETDVLRQQLFQARAELNGLRGEVARRADRETTLTLKLAALEQREAKLVEAQAAEAAAAAAKASAAARLAEKAKLPKPAAVAQAPAPNAAPSPTPPASAMSAVERLAASAGAQSAPGAATGAPRPAGSPIETASIPAGQATAQPKPETNGGAAVQLGTGPSVDALRLNWANLSQRHQATLQKLQPRYTTSRDPLPGAPGPAYDLLAGPLPSTAEAQKLCEALRAQYVSCRVSTFGGNAL